MILRFYTRLIHTLLALFTLTALSGCADDFFDRAYAPTGEGEVTIEACVDFRPMSGALSRSAGNSIGEIDKIWMLVYNLDGNLVFSTQKDRDEVTISSENRTDSDTGTEFDRAEDKTERARFKVTVPYGIYHIYAVANVGDLADYTDQIATETDLKAIRFVWNNEDITANSQMFGYFAPEGENWTGSEAPEVRLDASTRQLSAWMKRVASKVTVAYDGSKLRNGVEIYIKSVTIKDIPYSSQLGEGNAVKATDDIKYAEAHDSHTIVYGEGDMEQAENWPCVTKQNPQGLPNISSDHSSTAEALFFFENMQGTGADKEKWQDADGDGLVDYPEANNPESDDFVDHKDGRSYGTYIEVEAYYKAALFDNTGAGRIVYRFMLGKDTSKDYNAERNHHYKLTLCFNGNANDVDWHIDYERDPGIYYPKPYYISYVYNEGLVFPLEIVGEVTGQVRADILSEDPENLTSWAPYNAEPTFDYYRGEIYNKGPWNGFLALRYTDDAVVPGAWSNSSPGQKEYWENHNEGWRLYNAVPQDTPYDASSTEGSYTVTKEGNLTTINLPLYTRAKQLVKPSAYTGNNVFTAYRRKAVVTFSATINGKPYRAKAEIIQVERVVNPKGIWRSSNCDDEFHVEMKIRKAEEDEEFINVESVGPWTATFVYGSDAFGISSENGNYGSADVTGLSGTAIDFWVRPKGKIGSNEVKYGLIKVTYHDNQCIHYIMLRQGYAPLDVTGKGTTQWHSYNMYAKNTEALSPLEEGSMFKFGNWEHAILATNNTRAGFGFGEAPGVDGEFWLAGDSSQTWDKIPPYGVDMQAYTVHQRSFSVPAINGYEGQTVRVARAEDFAEIYNDDNMGYGYGVLYGDGATATAKSASDAYGYYRDGTTTESTKGMRGCFVYNRSDGRNIFFPIGASGYGHRKSQYDEDVDGGYAGVLRYAGRSKVMTWYDLYGMASSIGYRPLFYDVYKSAGAVYYIEKYESADAAPSLRGTKDQISAWDINYHTFDFFSYIVDATNCLPGGYGGNTNTNKLYGADAAFVRCVTVTAPTGN